MSDTPFKVICGGVDQTAQMFPFIKSITIVDGPEFGSDTAEIDFNDQDKVIEVPVAGSVMEIFLGTTADGLAQVFTGTVDESYSSGSRSAGSNLIFRAKGIDTTAGLKKLQTMHFDKALISDMLNEMAGGAGVDDMRIDDDIGSMIREYESIDRESFLGFGNRIADETGGVFRVRNNVAVMAKKNSGENTEGETLPTTAVAYGTNLLTWGISPYVTRPKYSEIIVRYYDDESAEWLSVRVETGLEDGLAGDVARFDAANKEDAEQKANAMAQEMIRQTANGFVTILGDASVQPESICNISGIREGVDGQYMIGEVTHSYSRALGFETEIKIKQKIDALVSEAEGT